MTTTAEPIATNDADTRARYYSAFYPMHLALMAVGDNVFPVAWVTPVSKDPFRFIAAIDRSNYSLELLNRHREAILHYFDWSDRERIVRAGYSSGRRRDKKKRLGFVLEPAAALTTTGRVSGALAAFELRVIHEVDASDGDHAVFLFDVVHVHRGRRPAQEHPLLFLGYRDFATLGDRWRFRP